MRITEAAQRLGTSPRMLRYRELLGLLPPVREPAVTGSRPPDPHLPTRSRPGSPAPPATGSPAPPAVSGSPAPSATPASPATPAMGKPAPRATPASPAPPATGSPAPPATGKRATRAWVREDDHNAAGLSMSPAGRRAVRGHRRFSDDDLAAVALALRIEQRYDVSPAALAFGLRVLTEPRVRAEVAELGRRIGKIGPPPARALEFEKERALRLLSLARNTHPNR